MEDKYPLESDRRRFVKGVVGGAALASIGTGAAATFDVTTSPTGAGGGIIQYLGVENIDGPAPRAMPQIPVEVDSEGYLKGVWPAFTPGAEVAEMQLGGERYGSDWFQYCGVQTYPGIAPDADQDDFLRAASGSPYGWQNEALSPGDRLHVEDFADYETWGNEIGRPGIGKPAIATWRSENTTSQQTIPVQVVRSARIREQRENPPAGVSGEWLRVSTTEEGFVAWLDKCTHFCCVPGFKAYRDSVKFDAEDKVYCQCHQSVYDPFSIVKMTFVALPRPER